MTHFETFARLRDADLTDVTALCRLSDNLPAGCNGERPVWPMLIGAIDAHVLVATECQLPVGAVVIWHHKDGAEARLAWLGVALDARGRGIGTLLLNTAIGAVAAHRAEAVTARLPREAEQLSALLRGAGFDRGKGGTMRLQLSGEAQ